MAIDSQPTPVAIITGGSSGIGLATAMRFASEGYHVGICGRRSMALESAKEQILAAGKLTDSSGNRSLECFTFVADLSDVDQAKKFAQAAIKKFGSIDVLVNNAALAPLAPFEEITAEDFEAIINTNLRSSFYLTQIIWRNMKRTAQTATESRAGNQKNQQGRGVVVNISSLAAVDPFPGFSLYGASKAWLDLISLALAAEGRELGLRVCSVRPGAVETPLLRSLFPDFPADQCVLPERIADAVWRCVAEPKKFPSGQAFEITAATN